MKPFDLESARRGDPVCTADGREVRLFSTEAPEPGCVLGVIKTDGQWMPQAWRLDGNAHAGTVTCSAALRMAPRKETRWVVTWVFGGRVYGDAYETENRAREAVASLQADYCKRHSFSINPIEVDL